MGCHTRIAEIFRNLDENSVTPIDLDNKLHRETEGVCVCHPYSDLCSV